MKMWILAMTMTVAVAANAQDKKHYREHFTTEQRAELKAKKMTLALDLNEKQQKDVQKLFAENGKAHAEFIKQHKAERQTGKKLTTDEKFAVKSRILDDRIAMNNNMKKILNEQQFEKFEQMKARRHNEMAKKRHNFRNHNKR